MILLIALAAHLAQQPQPTFRYTVHVDSTRHDRVDVTLHVDHAPARLRLAMRRHAEYDARAWRYLQFTDSNVVRLDTALWEARLPRGEGDIRYVLHLPAETPGPFESWRTTVRDQGAMLNPADVFLYPVDFTNRPSTVDLDVPAAWTVATSLGVAGNRHHRTARNFPDLLDSPILTGVLAWRSFRESNTDFNIAYWDLASPGWFNDTAFVRGVSGLAHAALGVFGTAPVRDYTFLIADKANDALEHHASLNIGIPLADLQRDPHAHTVELTHEFLHTWLLVAAHPDGFGVLTYKRTPPTDGLWWAEGVVIHYADVLPRRAGIVPSTDSTRSRAAHLADLLSRYLAASWRNTVAPVAASRAFGNSILADSNAVESYYMQGELLGEALDALVRDSTRESRTLDDVMHGLYVRSHNGRGISERDFEAVANGVCHCNLDDFFATQVRAPGTIDLRPALARLGWRLLVDTVQATDASGAPLPDLRLSSVADDSGLRLVNVNATTKWARSHIVTGDVLLGINGMHPAGFLDLYFALHRLHIGDTAQVQLRREGSSETYEIDVPITGYSRPRVRFVDAGAVSGEQYARRAKWLNGW